IASAAAAILGTTLTAGMTAQLAQPIFFGGLALTMPLVADSAAGFWCSWVATAAALQAGLPYQKDPDRRTTCEAKGVLAAPWWTLPGSSWSQELFTSARDAEGAQAQALDPDRSALATFVPGADVGDVE
ncbi:unnamed protein product, partial [Prorocentrum cordatum]